MREQIGAPASSRYEGVAPPPSTRRSWHDDGPPSQRSRSPAPSTARVPDGAFVRRDGDRFVVAGQPFAFIGANIDPLHGDACVIDIDDPDDYLSLLSSTAIGATFSCSSGA